MFRIDLPSAHICLRLLFWSETRRVINVVAENHLAIFTVLSGIEDVLMPELVHFRRRRRNEILLALASERVEKSFVLEFYLFRFFRSPAQLFNNLAPHEA